jgi:hypothetical protein
MRSRIFPLAIISLFTPICFVALHTPHSTQAALGSAFQQDRVPKEVPEACPVTKPSAQPFIPPLRYLINHGPDQFWYGTESLWTLLGVQETWHIHGNVLESEGAYRTKLTYWRKGFDWRTEPEPELIVIAKRLDRQSSPVAAESANAVFLGESAMMTVIDIPTAGCWKLTAQYGCEKLSFVVSVQP